MPFFKYFDPKFDKFWNLSFNTYLNLSWYKSLQTANVWIKCVQSWNNFSNLLFIQMDNKQAKCGSCFYKEKGKFKLTKL